jgi:hypothetical protein
MPVLEPESDEQPDKPGPTTGQMPPIAVEELEKLLPPENQELLHAVLEISGASDSDRTRLYAGLLGATFLTPLIKAPPENPPAPEAGKAPGEVTVEVLTLTGAQGEQVLPVFTHAAALQGWAEQQPWYQQTIPTISLTGEAVFQLASGSPIAIVLVNPGGPFGGQVPRNEFQALAQGLHPGVVEPEVPAEAENVYIDLPLVPVLPETIDRLLDIFEEHTSITRAYLFLMQVGQSGSPQLTIGLQADGPAAPWVIPQMTRLLQNETLSFEPYSIPELLRLDLMEGAEAVQNMVPPLFARTPESGRQGHGPADEGSDHEEAAVGAAADNMGEDFSDEARRGLDTEESYATGPSAEPADEASDEADLPPAAPVRRRPLWPFGRR